MCILDVFFTHGVKKHGVRNTVFFPAVSGLNAAYPITSHKMKRIIHHTSASVGLLCYIHTLIISSDVGVVKKKITKGKYAHVINTLYSHPNYSKAFVCA